MREDPKKPAGTRRPIFSDAVDQLAREELPDDETVSELLRALSAALVVELKRRGVWQAPPSFLRILGPSWHANDGEALDELTQDAYLYIFAQRLATLIEGRRRGHDVGPLVLKMVRQCVSHRQRLADPVGYCVYSRLHEAVRQLVKAGKLYGVKDDERIQNTTVLAFEPGGDVTPAEGETLAERVIPWTELLMPELVTALGKAVIPLIDRLKTRVLSLHVDGAAAFRFGDLVAPVKRNVRPRWETACPADDVVEVFEPRNLAEYESLLDCVQAAIGRHRPDGEQGLLWYFWVSMRGVHRIGDEPRRVPTAGMARLLDVSRRQVGKLAEVLKNMVSTCLTAFETPNRQGGGPSATPSEPIPDPEDDAPRADSAGR